MATEAVRAGNHWNDPHDVAVKEVTRGLRELGILTGRLPALIRDGSYRPFFMHRTSHWLGSDVHDVGDYRIDETWRLLEPGMALTIEPGIYIQPRARGVAKHWRGIGIRIEDDVVVTRKEPNVLTKQLPSTVADIESLMSHSS